VQFKRDITCAPLAQASLSLVHEILVESEAEVGDTHKPRVLRVRSQNDAPGSLLIAIGDSGPGLDSETMERLFDLPLIRFVVRSSTPTALLSGRLRSRLERSELQPG
jgi:hypothetical protein